MITPLHRAIYQVLLERRQASLLTLQRCLVQDGTFSEQTPCITYQKYLDDLVDVGVISSFQDGAVLIYHPVSVKYICRAGMREIHLSRRYP